MSLIPSKENPTRNEVEEYVKNASLDELASKVSELKAKQKQTVLHPAEGFFIEEYNKRIKKAGRRRPSKKQSARRRRRSSKARKSRKSRATRRR
jgi:hypothetical protein